MITGANMGGKSVALRTIVLNILLCRLGFYVFAKEAKIPLFDEVFLVCEDMQDFNSGLSSFGAEIIKFNEITSQIKSGFVFAALDEFARGTNPQEGAAVVRAAASWLAEKSGVCVMSTHYENVVPAAAGHYQVAGLSNLNFDKLPAEVGAIARYMDYRMLPAGSSPPPKDALNICRLLGLDKEILDKI
jgi:dsDNA-specific endonuclease/ATPase MutS2